VAGTGVAGIKNGTREQANFSEPANVVVDRFGTIFVSDSGNNCIRIISENEVSTLAGSGICGHRDGFDVNACFARPRGIVLDRSERHLYIADRENHKIRMIDIETSKVTTIQSKFTFKYPTDVTIDREGSLIISDFDNHCFVKLLGVAKAAPAIIKLKDNLKFLSIEGTRSPHKFTTVTIHISRQFYLHNTILSCRAPQLSNVL